LVFLNNNQFMKHEPLSFPTAFLLSILTPRL
jgi:hypothetical protein